MRIVGKVARLAALVMLATAVAAAAPQRSAPQPCSGGDYARALCLYSRQNYETALSMFKAIAERDEKAPETMKAHYFAARSEMKLKRWSEAAEELRNIYDLSPLFYREWSCDFLLGECRRALGKE